MTAALIVILCLLCLFAIIGCFAAAAMDAPEPAFIGIFATIIVIGLICWVDISDGKRANHIGIVGLTTTGSNQTVIVKDKSFNITQAFGKFFPENTKFYILEYKNYSDGISYGNGQYSITPLDKNFQAMGKTKIIYIEDGKPVNPYKKVSVKTSIAEIKKKIGPTTAPTN